MIAHDPRQHTMDVLNELYAAERRSLLPRLAELDAFVEWACAPEMEQVRRMMAEETAHVSWLAEAADCCDAVLFPAPPDASTASLHYADLRCLLPRVIDSVERLAQIYGRAAHDSAGLVPEVAETVSRIHHQHQTHLEQLRSIQQRLG